MPGDKTDLFKTLFDLTTDYVHCIVQHACIRHARLYMKDANNVILQCLFLAVIVLTAFAEL